MFFPYEDYTITTNLTFQEIEQRFNQEIQQETFADFIFGDDDKYGGVLHDKDFKIKRLVGGNKDMKVIINGRIEESGNQTIIFVKMRITVLMIIFWIVWLGGTTIVGISTLIEQIQNHSVTSDILIFLLMFTMGYCFMTLFFKYESSKNKQYLNFLFSTIP
jgi:hypothetical protein